MRRAWQRIGATALAATAVAAVPAGAEPASTEKIQWGLTQVKAEQAWSRTTGASIRIGIVDTGVDLAHEDLAGRVVAHTNCIGSAGDPALCHGSGQDDNGHGTHMAGTAAALRGNGRGIAGVAPDAELVVAKAVSANGIAVAPDVLAGIRWVVDHGAEVVNLSLSDPDMTVLAASGAAFHDALDYAWERGTVPVLASGTTSRFQGMDPRSDRDLHALVVGSTGSDRRQSRTSVPTGAALLGVLAPGGTADGSDSTGVLSSFWSKGKPNDYRYLSGTSVAAAFVSGGVALLRSQGYSAWGSVERLLWTADGTVTVDQASPSCYGLLDLDAFNAV
jgi:subtilisin family serine protease